LDDLPDEWKGSRAESFLTNLSYSDPGSIDAYLEANPSDADLGKYLIARELKSRERLETLFPPNDAGWYRYLFDSLLVDGEPQFDRSALSIVTFNYDRSLEAYFLTRLQARFAMSFADATKVLSYVPIVHVHGILGHLPEVPYQTATTPHELIAISRQIQIIHEIADTDDAFCNDMFSRAHSLLASSDRILFLGFGFHTDNVRRFRFFVPESTAAKETLAAVGAMGTMNVQRIKRQLSPYGLAATTFSQHECGIFFNYDATLD
jgi:hypothetical protein